jgi:hypothetical protein
VQDRAQPVAHGSRHAHARDGDAGSVAVQIAEAGGADTSENDGVISRTTGAISRFFRGLF